MPGPQLTPTLWISRHPSNRETGFITWATSSTPLLPSAHWAVASWFLSPALLKCCSNPHLVAQIIVTSEAPRVGCFLSQCCLKLCYFFPCLHFCGSHIFSPIGDSRVELSWCWQRKVEMKVKDSSRHISFRFTTALGEGGSLAEWHDSLRIQMLHLSSSHSTHVPGGRWGQSGFQDNLILFSDSRLPPVPASNSSLSCKLSLSKMVFLEERHFPSCFIRPTSCNRHICQSVIIRL